MVVVESSNKIDDLVTASKLSGYSRFPVIGADIDDIVGIVEVRDVFTLTPADRKRAPLSEILRPVTVVPEHRELDGVLVDLEVAASRLAVVVDEHGGTAGLITREDILEELVGDIADEYDEPVPVTAKHPDGRAVVSGTSSKDEVEELLGLRLPQGPFETVAGFVLQQFGFIPDVGQTIEWQGWRFEVVRKEHLRLADIAVESPDVVERHLPEQEGTR
jgi:CBS domain containing-hemolysin-like protein